MGSCYLMPDYPNGDPYETNLIGHHFNESDANHLEDDWWPFGVWDFYNATASCIEANIGNKICEPDNNHVGCNYDGGDCCRRWVIFAQECQVDYWQQSSRASYANLQEGCYCAWHALPMDLALRAQNCSVTSIDDPWNFDAWTRIGDGICDDDLSNERCLNDMSDCCAPIIDASRCTECICPIDDLSRGHTKEEYLAFINSWQDDDFPRSLEHFRLYDSWWINQGMLKGISVESVFAEKEDLSLEKCFQRAESGQVGADTVQAIWSNGFCEDFRNNADCNWDLGDCCIPIVDAIKCDNCICHLDGQVHPQLRKYCKQNSKSAMNLTTLICIYFHSRKP